MNKKNINYIFLILLAYIFLFGLGDYGLLSKDEPRYAGCALEMIENNDWIVPKFNFQDRFDKPALFYWLIVLSYKTFGINEFTSRLPSAISAIFLVLFTWYIGNRSSSKNAGFLSALVLATSIEYIFLGRRAATDIVLCLFFSATLYSLFLYYSSNTTSKKNMWITLSGIFMGLAILTKGPVGLVLPLLIFSIFLILNKELSIEHIKTYIKVSLISILISLPWYISVHVLTKGGFTRDFFFLHNVQRFTSVVGEHPGPIWFYIPILLIGFLPWTFFLIPALCDSLKNINQTKNNKFLFFNIIWAVSIFLFFSASKTKLFTYLLLLFPAISFITGIWLEKLLEKRFETLKKILFISLLILSLGMFMGVFISPILKLDTDNTKILNFKLITSSIFIITTSILFFRNIKKNELLILLFITIFYIPGISILNTSIKASYIKSFKELKEYSTLARKMGAEEIISYAGYKPILVYYGRVPVDFTSQKKQLLKIKRKLEEKKEVFIISQKSDIKKLKQNLILSDKDFLKCGKRYCLIKLSKEQ